MYDLSIEDKVNMFVSECVAARPWGDPLWLMRILDDGQDLLFELDDAMPGNSDKLRKEVTDYMDKVAEALEDC